MATSKDSSAVALASGEAVLIDVLRLVLRGRGDEVPARVRKLVTTQAGRRKANLSEQGRAAIALLLSEEAARPSSPPQNRGVAVRRKASTSAPDVGGAAEEALNAVLAADSRKAMDDIVREYAERDHLAASGLRPTRSVLLSGPPGVGKTMTMNALAARIGRPLVRIEPTDVVGSLLGESARSLTALIAEARDQHAVLGLDEIDALAKRRDDVHDVGEFKRLVSTLLLELDRWPGHAPVIAATNHLDLLDPALERRFEAHIRLDPPDEFARREILHQSLARLALQVTPETVAAVAAVATDSTGASLTAMVTRAARRAVLDQTPIDHALLAAAAPRDASADRRGREKFAAVARDTAGLSSRTIGELLGCSHTAAQRLAQAGAAHK